MKARRNLPKLPQFLGLLALVALIGALGMVFTRSYVDFPVYYAAGRSLINGRTDLYAGDFAKGPTMDYRYPPFFLVALVPLWQLPYQLSAYVWYILQLLALAACCWVVLEVLKRGSHSQLSVGSVSYADSASAEGKKPGSQNRDAAWAFALAVLGVAQYFVMALHYGNAQLLVTAILLLGLYLAMRGRDLLPALLVALAITIKITPALFLGYFAAKRRWKLLMITLGLVLALNLAPGFYFGFARNTELMRAWYDHVIGDQEFHETNGPINLSLKGQFARSLTRVDYSLRVDGDTRYPAVNIADYSYKGIATLWLAVSALAVALGLALIALIGTSNRGDAQMPQPEGAVSGSNNTLPVVDGTALVPNNSMPSGNILRIGDLTSLEIGIMLCLMLLGAPLTSKIYFVALLWPLALILQIGIRGSVVTPRLIRWGALSVVILNVVLPLLPGRSVQRLLLVVGVDFYLTCLLLAMLVWALLAGRRPPPQ